jgi:antitoxin PrlF
MIAATITSKGQITIPAEIRAVLGLGAGDKIVFEEVTPGSFTFKPATKLPVTALKGMFGRARKKATIEEMNATIAKRAAGQ